VGGSDGGGGGGGGGETVIQRILNRLEASFDSFAPDKDTRCLLAGSPGQRSALVNKFLPAPEQRQTT